MITITTYHIIPNKCTGHVGRNRGAPGADPGFARGGGAKCCEYVRPSKVHHIGALHSENVAFSNQFPAFWWDRKDFYKCFHKSVINLESAGGGAKATKAAPPPTLDPPLCIVHALLQPITNSPTATSFSFYRDHKVSHQRVVMAQMVCLIGIIHYMTQYIGDTVNWRITVHCLVLGLLACIPPWKCTEHETLVYSLDLVMVFFCSLKYSGLFLTGKSVRNWYWKCRTHLFVCMNVTGFVTG